MMTSQQETKPSRLHRFVPDRLRDWLNRPLTSAYLVLAIMVLLLAIGVVMVLAASSARSALGAKTGIGNPYAVMSRQLIWIALGAVGFVLASRLPVAVIRRFSMPMVSVSLILLVLVLIPGIGRKINGARSWIGVGEALSFQPSEIAKLALLLWSAHVFTARRSELSSLPQLLIPVVPVTVVMGLLIMLQPDLGTLVTLAIVLAAVLWFVGAPLWLFTSSSVIGVAGIILLIVTSEFRLNRVKALLDPEAYPQYAFQLLQGLYGMADGGLLGVGISGSRAKWLWLPLSDSDFIFAIVGETIGFIGAVFVILLFALLAYTGMRIAKRNVDPYSRLVASAATTWLVLQAAINIGYVVGILPTTGLPLPLISAGGTSLVTSMFVFGLLMNFARRETAAANALYRPGGSRLARFLGLGSGQRKAARSQRAMRKAEAKAAKQAQRAAARASTQSRREAARTSAQMTARTPAAARGHRGRGPTQPGRGMAPPARGSAQLARPGTPARGPARPARPGTPARGSARPARPAHPGRPTGPQTPGRWTADRPRSGEQ